MRLLLDTHVFLWVVSDHRRLTRAARDLLDAADDVFVSAASIWEIAIKRALGRIDVEPGVLADAIGFSGMTPLPVTAAHAAEVARLPDRHRDPFDRMLVAQAICEPLRLVTADAALAGYSDVVLPLP